MLEVYVVYHNLDATLLKQRFQLNRFLVSMYCYCYQFLIRSEQHRLDARAFLFVLFLFENLDGKVVYCGIVEYYDAAVGPWFNM